MTNGITDQNQDEAQSQDIKYTGPRPGAATYISVVEIDKDIFGREIAPKKCFRIMQGEHEIYLSSHDIKWIVDMAEEML